MDLEALHKIFQNTELLRNNIFSTIGYLNILNISDMMVFVKERKYLADLYKNPNVSAVITNKEYAEEILEHTDCGILVAEDPERLFYLAHNYLYQKTSFYKKEDFKTTIESGACISPKAVIAEKNVRIGKDTVVEPGAVIMQGVQIGSHCVIGANTTIGTRGFQYYRKGDEAFYIEHIGGVVLEDNVEVLSGSCIASGLIIPTYLCKNVKLDNLVHVGHSAYLDKRVLAAAGTIIGGSVYVGERTWLGINSTICASVHIGADAFICMGAVVTKDAADGAKVSGNFAIDHKKQVEFIKSIC